MAFGSKFAGIEVKIGADTSRLGRDMRKADGIVGRFSKAASNALMGVGIAAGAAAVKIGVDGVKAYIEDEKAARKLSVTLQNVAGAKAEQIASVEEYITKTMFASGVADDQLRPAMARLLRSTQDITKSQKLMNLALDVSAGTGKSLDSVAMALGKSYDGSNASLSRLGLGLDANILKEGKFNDITKELRKNFQGFAEADANTMEGKLERLNLRWQETKEQIGGVILEGLEPLMEWFETAEGQKVIEDLLNGMVEAFKFLAAELPGIVTSLTNLLSSFKNSNIDFSGLATPGLVAGALAYKYTPGGPQFKVAAALMAYLAADPATQERGNWAQEPGALEKAGKTNIPIPGVSITQEQMDASIAARQANLGNVLLGAGTKSGASSWQNPIPGLRNQLKQIQRNNGATVNITINQATDPKQTAINVQRAIAKAERMGVNSGFLGKGLGN